MHGFLLGAVALAFMGATAPASAQTAGEKRAVLATYADIAQAMYQDATSEARKLQASVTALVGKPSAAALATTRTAWLAARVPYQQTEVFRFGNAIVDDWEGKVNAWPLDEGLIDYVDDGRYGSESDENPWYTANIIANPKLKIAGRAVDATAINWRLLRSLQEAGGVEANVATGYHAIEFLLWGQDLNGTGPGAGDRPWTDYAKGAQCTNGNCDRRGQYLAVATQLLVDDLVWMTGQWKPGGEARSTPLNKPDAGIAAMVTGIGSLAYGELAGERMKLGLMLHDPEEEHDCFSDNTHNSHYYDVIGMRAVWSGSYRRVGGAEVKGASLSALVARTAPELASEMTAKLDASVAAMTALKTRAEGTERYDQMLAEGNVAGNAVVQAAIDRLTEQTRTLERVASALKLGQLTI
jgi:putative iron-regulated protein